MQPRTRVMHSGIPASGLRTRKTPSAIHPCSSAGSRTFRSCTGAASPCHRQHWRARAMATAARFGILVKRCRCRRIFCPRHPRVSYGDCCTSSLPGPPPWLALWAETIFASACNLSRLTLCCLWSSRTCRHLDTPDNPIAGVSGLSLSSL